MFDRIVKNLVEKEGVTSVIEIPVGEISVNPYQPRRNFNKEKLEGLAVSIKQLGVVQPIIVRKVKGGYELVTGERRLRACKIAGLKTVPAIVRALDDQAVIEITFIENLQREQLDDIEKSEAYGRLLENPCTIEETAGRVGKDARTIEDRLWARNLPGVVKKAVSAGVITTEQARLIAAVEDEGKQNEMLEQIAALNSCRREARKQAGDDQHQGGGASYQNLEAFVTLIRQLMSGLRASGIKSSVTENFNGDSLDINMSFKLEKDGD